MEQGGAFHGAAVKRLPVIFNLTKLKPRGKLMLKVAVFPAKAKGIILIDRAKEVRTKKKAVKFLSFSWENRYF